jgi:hypothetical protein
MPAFSGLLFLMTQLGFEETFLTVGQRGKIALRWAWMLAVLLLMMLLLDL